MPSVTCPTCGMSASKNDHRQLAPVEGDGFEADLRSCRNCGDIVDLSAMKTPFLAS